MKSKVVFNRITGGALCHYSSWEGCIAAVNVRVGNLGIRIGKVESGTFIFGILSNDFNLELITVRNTTIIESFPEILENSVEYSL